MCHVPLKGNSFSWRCKVGVEHVPIKITNRWSVGLRYSLKAIAHDLCRPHADDSLLEEGDQSEDLGIDLQ